MKHFDVKMARLMCESDDPERYHAGFARIGPTIDAQKLSATLYELPPDQSHCPYHYEYGNEEWLIVLEGHPTIRHPDGETEVAPGTIVCFPPGPSGAHKLTNHTATTAKYLMLSTNHDPAIIVYPDSDKIAAYPGDPRDPRDNLITRREHTNTDYWDGET